jgi:tetratricopeptide (TPR) repeat protein
VSAEDADAVLDDAAQKFQEAAALALFNWGNVHMCAARKAMDGGRDPPLEEGGPPGAAVATADNRDEVIDRLDQAKSRYEAALGVKPDFHDATIALAQRRYERARLLTAAAGLSGAGESPAEGNADSDEAEAEFSGACADFDAVLAILPEDPPKPEKEPEKKEEKKEGEEEEAEQPSMRAQVQVMWGNTLFEQSQMRARLGKEWRPLLDVAVEKFKGAGCAEADIEQALKVHRGVRAEKEA